MLILSKLTAWITTTVLTNWLKSESGKLITNSLTKILQRGLKNWKILLPMILILIVVSTLAFLIGMNSKKISPGDFDINDEIIPKFITKEIIVETLPDLNCNVPYIRKPQEMKTYGDLMGDYKKAYDFVYLCGTSIKDAQQRLNS